MAPNIFEVRDKTNRKIRLTSERWKHIATEHPNVTNIEEIKDTIIKPLVVKQSKYDPKSVRWHYSFNKAIKRYLFVAVKYINGDGFIITAYYMRNIK